MIKKGQKYRADKSQIVMEIVGQQTQRHPGAKVEWIMRPYATVDGERAPDFPIWKESFAEEVAAGRWILDYDPDAPVAEVTAPRNRMDDIE
jgi:hypothetical protein